MQQSDYVIEWLKKLAAACRIELSEDTMSVYVEQLMEYPQDKLNAGFQKTLREWDKSSQFPPLAFILARIADRQLEGEQAWVLAQRLISQNYHPDFGGWYELEGCRAVSKRPEALTPAIQYAIAQVGGPLRMMQAELSALPFMRRDFLNAIERFLSEGGAQLQLSQADADRSLRQLIEARREISE